jgi:hypothetical protein
MAKGLGTTLTKIPTSSITDSTIAVTNLVTTGTASSSTYLKGDLSWGTVSIVGKINTAASDPGSNTAGDIWYTGGKFKFAVEHSGITGVWTTANNTGTGGHKTNGCGSQSNAIQVCAENVPGNASMNTCQAFNGVTWRNVADMINSSGGRANVACAGTATACHAAGGNTAAGPPNWTTSADFDGSAWSAGPTTVTRYQAGCAGIQSNCIFVSAKGSMEVQTYNGTAYTTVTDYPIANQGGYIHGAGASGDDAMCFAGYVNNSGTQANTYLAYKWDSSAWAAIASYPLRYANGGNGVGTTSAGMGISGVNPDGSNYLCYSYDGTSWAAESSVNDDRYDQVNAGSISAALTAMGGSSGNSQTSCETFDKPRLIFSGI